MSETEEQIAIFQDYFDREIEAGFTSSIACCGECFEDFKADWPGTVARDIKLQAGSIDITTFIEGSRIPDVFSAKEINLLSKYLYCPRCGAILSGVFHVYEHPFTIPENYRLADISRIASKFPFLLLSNPFAKDVFDAICRLRVSTVSQLLPKVLYRARMLPTDCTPDISAFGPPPSSKVSEGRFNHAGHSMLYLADSSTTAAAEIRAGLSKIHVASLEIATPATILDLCISDEIDSGDQDTMQTLARSTLCAAPRVSEGWDRPEYVFSRFVADCARYAGFTVIRYGSVQDPSGTNFVILDPDQCFRTAMLIGVETT